jgi:hypothetical protein
LGLRDDINLMEVAAAGAAMGVMAQISSTLGPALNNNVASQSAIALGANLVTQLVLGTDIDVASLLGKSLGRGIGVMVAPLTGGAAADVVRPPKKESLNV